MSIERVVVAGAGQAAQEAAIALRRGGYAGTLTLVGDEPHLPYQRPPLSKSYLEGGMSAADLHLETHESLAERDIAFRSSRSVTAIDRKARCVHLSSAEMLPYDHLILATGSRPRTIAGFEAALSLRTLDDADILRARLASAKSAIVIGAGFIGLEFAAMANAMGVDLTVVEREAQVMSRVSSATVAMACQRHHEARGVNFLLSRQVVSLSGTGVTLDDGETLHADIVLSAIGVVPNDELARDCGLETANGIVTDAFLRTSDPAISAIGDCASFPVASSARHVRLESVQNAVDQGLYVAARILGAGAPYGQVPTFWTDQSGLRLQIAGLPSPHGTSVLRGDLQSGFSVFHLDNGRLIWAESINRPGDHRGAQALLAADVHPAGDLLSDPAVNLRDLAKGVAAA